MADLATTPEAAAKSGVRLYDGRVEWLERIIDEVGKMVESRRDSSSRATAMPVHCWTLPARSAWWAERHIAKLSHQAMLSNPVVLQYLNRLSSLLFVLSRLEDKAAASSSLHWLSLRTGSNS